MIVRLVSVAAAAVTVAPGLASASPVATPVGPVDSSCVHEVPNGAHVNESTGEVTVNGVVLAKHDDCAVSWAGSVPGGKEPLHGSAGTARPEILSDGSHIVPEGCSATGSSCSSNSQCCSGTCNGNVDKCGGDAWAEMTTANAVTSKGLTEYNKMQVSFTVPSVPDVAGDTTAQFMWSGLENLFSNGNWESIIQSEVVWGNISGTWAITSQAGQSGNRYWNSPNFAANPGDQIVATLTQINQSSSSGQEWEITTADTYTGDSTTFYYTTGSGWPGYNWAQLGVYEVQGLTSCAGLSKQGQQYFVLDELYEAGSSWNQLNNVEPLVTWTSASSSSISPQCSWHAQNWGPLDAPSNGAFFQWAD